MEFIAGKALVDATAIAAEAAGDKLTASTEAKLKAKADAIQAIEANSVVTVDATEAKFKATSTFDDSIPEANQVNFDVAAAEVNLKTEAEFITADRPLSRVNGLNYCTTADK